VKVRVEVIVRFDALSQLKRIGRGNDFRGQKVTALAGKAWRMIVTEEWVFWDGCWMERQILWKEIVCSENPLILCF